MLSLIDPHHRENVEAHVRALGKPTTQGEEGYLYRIPSIAEPGSFDWAKRWYRDQQLGLRLNDEAGGSATSPNFHAMRALEYGLIHEALPSVTPNPRGGYDTRVDDEALDILFRLAPGHPTTVAAEPPHDSERLKQLEKIKKDAYRALFTYKQSLVAGKRAVDLRNDHYVALLQSNTNDNIRALLGPDIKFPARSMDEFPYAVSQMRRRNPQNPMIAMIEYGIFPQHPEMNFIPGNAQTHPASPHGTFIEPVLYDPSKLELKMRGRLGERSQGYKNFRNKFDLYLIYKRLNDLFVLIVFKSNFGHYDSFKYDPSIIFEIYRLLEVAREAYEKRKDLFGDSRLDNHVIKIVVDAFQSQGAQGARPVAVAIFAGATRLAAKFALGK
ncbi:hypothetical protein HZA43_03005 [Candidatus Peregrinibacteria bacterium]|nr:hypothetical protein [Candidatus Peregrinibacteria bacterium]